MLRNSILNGFQKMTLRLTLGRSFLLESVLEIASVSFLLMMIEKLINELIKLVMNYYFLIRRS